MYKITKELSFAEEIELVFFGDLHYGSETCKIKAFKDMIEYIAKTKNCYCAAMGDMLEAILPKDKRFEVSRKNRYKVIDECVADITKMLKPIKDKILFMLTGNHEYKLYAEGYGDPILRIANELEVPYSGYSGFIKLRLPREKTHNRSIVIYAHHGTIAGRKKGSVINRVEALPQTYDADIYLVAHSHKLWGTVEKRTSWSGVKYLVFGNTGTFSETVEAGDDNISYAERAMYPPAKLGYLKVYWKPLKQVLETQEIIVR